MSILMKVKELIELSYCLLLRDSALWSYLRRTDNGYSAAIYHHVMIGFVCGRLLSLNLSTGSSSMTLFKRRKWLISILFSSLCCKFWWYPHYISSAWPLFSCLANQLWIKECHKADLLCRPLSSFTIILSSGQNWKPPSALQGTPVCIDVWHKSL